jgi:hypothetical protein
MSLYDIDENNGSLNNGVFSWERKTPRGYNNITARKTREIARELYGNRKDKLAEYEPELVDRGGW